MNDHWSEIARAWAHVGPPLRPAPEDLGFIPSAGDALLLGVTPELAALGWSSLVAVDHTPAMVRALWEPAHGLAVVGQWTHLPIRSSSRDLVLLDGGLHLVPHRLAQEALLREASRVLRPEGRAVVRLFARPSQPEPPQAVLSDLVEGHIANLNELKLRLGMAMQTDVHQGVALADVWRAVAEAVPDRDGLCQRLGWIRPHFDAIDSYRDSANRYWFVSTEEAIALASPWFAVERVCEPAYRLGERCPTLLLSKRPH